MRWSRRLEVKPTASATVRRAPCGPLNRPPVAAFIVPVAQSAGRLRGDWTREGKAVALELETFRTQVQRTEALMTSSCPHP
jgi:hypothetical protein